jgi:hypothetical protein
MSAPFRRLTWWFSYRAGIAPWDAGRPDDFAMARRWFDVWRYQLELDPR